MFRLVTPLRGVRVTPFYVLTPLRGFTKRSLTPLLTPPTGGLGLRLQRPKGGEEGVRTFSPRRGFCNLFLPLFVPPLVTPFYVPPSPLKGGGTSRRGVRIYEGRRGVRSTLSKLLTPLRLPTKGGK
jgi:hypothetical protein